MSKVHDPVTRLALKLDSYHFCYPERRHLDIHETHYHKKLLLTIRVVAYLYLTFIYLWTLVQMPTFNTNIIYLTMVGYLLTWLYFGLTLQHYFFSGLLWESKK